MKKEKEVVVNESVDKPDCFAWISKCKCNALREKKCINCSFYKNKAEVPNYKSLLKESEKML